MYTIYNSNNEPIISFESFISSSHSFESDVTNYTTENSFFSYDKIAKPDTHKITLATSVNNNIFDMIDIIQNLVKTTELVTIVTPSQIYNNVTITSFNYNNESNLHLFELSLQQINFEISNISERKEPFVPKVKENQSSKARGTITSQQNTVAPPKKLKSKLLGGSGIDG